MAKKKRKKKTSKGRIALIVALVVAYAVVVWALSCFVVGRDDMLVVNEPGLYHAVRSWFTLLP